MKYKILRRQLLQTKLSSEDVGKEVYPFIVSSLRQGEKWLGGTQFRWKSRSRFWDGLLSCHGPWVSTHKSSWISAGKGIIINTLPSSFLAWTLFPDSRGPWLLILWLGFFVLGCERSVVGMSFDFVVLNLTKHSSYLIYNASLFFSPTVQKQYYEKYGYGEVRAFFL